MYNFYLFLQSHYTRAQANSPRPIMTSSGPNPKGSQGTLASQQQSQSQQSQQPASQSHNSPGGSGREQREQRNSRSSRRKGSDSSVPEEDKDRREEATGRGEGSHKNILYMTPLRDHEKINPSRSMLLLMIKLCLFFISVFLICLYNTTVNSSSL